MMNREQSEGEGSGVETGTDRFVDATTETEVELRLPLEVDMEPDRIRKDAPIYPGADDLDVVSPDSETQRRFAPPNGAKLKWARHGVPLPSTPQPQLPGARAQPVGFGDGRARLECPARRIRDWPNADGTPGYSR